MPCLGSTDEHCFPTDIDAFGPLPVLIIRSIIGVLVVSSVLFVIIVIVIIVVIAILVFLSVIAVVAVIAVIVVLLLHLAHSAQPVSRACLSVIRVAHVIMSPAECCQRSGRTHGGTVLFSGMLPQPTRSTPNPGYAKLGCMHHA